MALIFFLAGCFVGAAAHFASMIWYITKKAEKKEPKSEVRASVWTEPTQTGVWRDKEFLEHSQE